MAKNKKQFKETAIENYYDLKVDKMDELVAALKDENYKPETPVSMDITECTGVDDPNNYTKRGKKRQFDPYRNDFLGKIPVWLKALFIKWWFAGAVCYFVHMGLQYYIKNVLDTAVLAGVVLGLVVEILVNPIFRFLESDAREYDPYMMFPFPFKAYWTFFANIVYYLIVAGVHFIIHTGINHLFTLPIEPLSLGLIFLAVDMFFIGIKDLIVYLIRRTRKKEIADV